MATQENKKSPKITRNPTKKSPEDTQHPTNKETSSSSSSMFSPTFKSVAAMAGWDEETLLLASLIVEDTPERNLKDKKHVKSPPTSSRRKRRARRPGSVRIAVFNLDDEDESTSKNGKGNEQKVECTKTELPKVFEKDEGKAQEGASASESTSSTLPCMDRLREELSCAICLEICFEPSTTACGHSFCKKCLRSAADKCGKRCPKCRQLISNGRSCTVNTVLWNTIQLLFPEEVEKRKSAGALNSRETEREISEKTNQDNISLRTSRRIRPVGFRRDDNNLSSREDGSRNRRGVPSEDDDAAYALRLQREEENMAYGQRMQREGATRNRRGVNQDEDAAYALRLQREEAMAIYRGSSSLARDNLRAMAQRAINLRVRHRAV